MHIWSSLGGLLATFRKLAKFKTWPYSPLGDTRHFLSKLTFESILKCELYITGTQGTQFIDQQINKSRKA